jgi:hypothetical protein
VVFLNTVLSAAALARDNFCNPILNSLSQNLKIHKKCSQNSVSRSESFFQLLTSLTVWDSLAVLSVFHESFKGSLRCNGTVIQVSETEIRLLVNDVIPVCFPRSCQKLFSFDL